jgi:TonB family protein
MLGWSGADDSARSRHFLRPQRPAGKFRLRKGERIIVEFSPNHPPLAGSIRIQGMVGEHLTAQEATKPEVAVEQLSKPSCLYCPNPDFPNEAKMDGIFSARAVVEITVSEKGSVDPHDIGIIEDPGHGFIKAAVATVKKWKFKPGTDKNGKPAKTRTTAEFTWHRSVVH